MAPAIPVAIALAKTAAAAVAKSAVGVAIKGAATKLASSALVTGLKTVGAKIASSAIGQGVKTVAGKVASSAFGQGVKSLGSKAVTGFMKAKSSTAVQSLANTTINQGAMNAFQGAIQKQQTQSSFSSGLNSFEDDSATTAAQNDRLNAYNESVFGSAMSLSNNTYAGESGGSGIFSSLIKSKKHTLT